MSPKCVCPKPASPWAVAVIALVESVTMPMLVAVSAVAVPLQQVATLVETVTAMVVVLTTAPHVATFVMNSLVLNSAKKPVVLKHPVARIAMTTVAVIALSSVRHQHTHGIVAIAVLPRVKTLAKMVPVKAVVGKNAVVTTAMQHVQHLGELARLVTSLDVAPSSLVPAISNPMLQQAKALQANVVAPVS